MKNDMTKEITPNVRKRMDEFDTLQKIVDQLEWCDYRAIGGPLESNIAFIKLKEMAKSGGQHEE